METFTVTIGDRWRWNAPSITRQQEKDILSYYNNKFNIWDIIWNKYRDKESPYRYCTLIKISQRKPNSNTTAWTITVYKLKAKDWKTFDHSQWLYHDWTPYLYKK